jgi:DNA invertase Pin-like site-specific DNA recombinase
MSTLGRFAHHQPAVKRMRAEEVSYKKIGSSLGISATTAWRLASDDHERSYQASTAASAAKRAAA